MLVMQRYMGMPMCMCMWVGMEVSVWTMAGVGEVGVTVGVCAVVVMVGGDICKGWVSDV